MIRPPRSHHEITIAPALVLAPEGLTFVGLTLARGTAERHRGSRERRATMLGALGGRVHRAEILRRRSIERRLPRYYGPSLLRHRLIGGDPTFVGAVPAASEGLELIFDRVRVARNCNIVCAHLYRADFLASWPRTVGLCSTDTSHWEANSLGCRLLVDQRDRAVFLFVRQHGLLHVIGDLQIEPELRLDAQRAAQADGAIHRDASAELHQVIDATHRQSRGRRQIALRQAQRPDEFILQDLPGVDVGQAVGPLDGFFSDGLHGRCRFAFLQSMIVSDPHIVRRAGGRVPEEHDAPLFVDPDAPGIVHTSAAQLLRVQARHRPETLDLDRGVKDAELVARRLLDVTGQLLADLPRGHLGRFFVCEALNHGLIVTTNRTSASEMFSFWFFFIGPPAQPSTPSVPSRKST